MTRGTSACTPLTPPSLRPWAEPAGGRGSTMTCSARTTRPRCDYRRRRQCARASDGCSPSIGVGAGHRTLQRVRIAELGEPAGGMALLSALCRDGVAILTPFDGACEITVDACYAACRAFFRLPFDVKASHGAGSGAGQQHGFMSYLDDNEGSECFEAKVHHDAAFTWPSRPLQMRAALLAMQRLMLRTACRALFALAKALGLDHDCVASLLDVDGAAGAAPRDGVDLHACSHTALRIWSYTRGRPTGWHVDNGLLTLAPAGSSVGLRVRTLDGRCCLPEEGMAKGELLVFAGDALSYLSAGRVPALMHEVAPPATDGNATPRLSAPFFLRPMRAQLLRPPPPLKPLHVEALERNPGNLRSQFPWKVAGPLAPYFQGQNWHVDESLES